ncbi:MAG: cytochrome P450 [Aphanothece sp. CMT-3BRIN-NPC111]|jgi:cytochrome P450|nr:cytochrome P450 [Aphanothece sp. CMT-3BRIN-NPC111]
MKLLDGPKTPAFLQTIQAIFSPLEYLEKFAQRYGDIFTTRFIGFPSPVVLCHPQAIQEVFTADPKLFDSGKANKILQPLLGEYSLILHDGDYHQRQRRLLIPPFHGERMRAYGKLICDITEQVISQCQIGEPLLARPLMQEISLRVILRAVFGIDEGARFQQLRQLLSSLLDIFNSPLKSSLLFIPALQQDLGPWSPWGQFIRQRQQIDQLLEAEISERRVENDQSREDILSLMMSARDQEGQPMTNAELRDELMTLLFAGHETTATALAWALYWIHHLPEVGNKLLNELDNLSDNSDPSEISRLPYLGAVCSETVRIYPVVLFGFSRIVKAPIQIMGYEFEPGTVLSPCIYLTHHREDIYPEPKRFKPERFLERQFSPYEYFPFGGSNRRCIGMAFAQLEMKLVLATILSRFQLALADNRPVKPVRRGLTMTPSGGVRLVVRSQRQKAFKKLVTQTNEK